MQGGVPHGRHSQQPHGAAVHEDGDVTWTSNKMPSSLRRHDVNEPPPKIQCMDLNSTHDAGIAEEMHAGAEFDTDFVNPDIDEDVVVNDATGEHHENKGDGGVNLCGNLQQNKACPSSLAFTTDQKWTIALLKVLDDMNAPDYAFKSIMEWARDARADGYSFKAVVGGVSRSRNVDSLINSVHNARLVLPSVLTVNCPHPPDSDVICFDFVPQLLSLLQNRSIMTAENLVIDVNDPLKPYTSPDHVLNEAISGSEYRKAYDRLITDPTQQLFVPIIQWIDRTKVSGNDRFSLKPYMFTPAIFKEKFRRSIKAWGYHGFLPKNTTSTAQNAIKKQGDNMRNYHQELEAVLTTFRESGPRLKGIILPIGSQGFIRVDIVTCVLFIIQDMQEGDQLCGRYGPHGPSIHRHSRSCNVSFQDLGNWKTKCSYLVASEMHQISQSDQATRTQWSQHQVNNAFNSIVFADPVRGIFGATPVETMHAFRKGILEHVTYLVLTNVPPSKKAAFDNLAIGFHKSHRQTYRKVYPSTDFTNGVTNLTKITAKERLGLVFLFVILFQYDEGWNIITKCFEKERKENTAGNQVVQQGIDVPGILEVLESLLTFDAWLRKSDYWSTTDPQECNRVMKRIKKSIGKFMKMCHDGIPNGRANAWKFPKFHELHHIVDDISRFGAPANFCAERPESLLIPAAKKPGRRAQKRHEGSAFELQAAQRLQQSFVIQSVYSRIWHDDALVEETSVDSGKIIGVHNLGQATFASVSRLLAANGKWQYEVGWRTKTDTKFMKVPPRLLQFLCDTFLVGDATTIQFCTEYKANGQTFRCHPCYQSDGAIYDWMKVDFGEPHGIRPCRLAAVVLVESPNHQVEDFQVKLVVQSVTEMTGVQSVLLTEWYFDDTYHSVSPDRIIAPCFVITITHDGSKVLVTRPLEEWADEFT